MTSIAPDYTSFEESALAAVPLNGGRSNKELIREPTAVGARRAVS
jgi:hypothetical protein